MTSEDQFVIALAVVSVLLLGIGSLAAKRMSTMPPRVMRTVWPLAAMTTAAVYAAFVFIARTVVKG